MWPAIIEVRFYYSYKIEWAKLCGAMTSVGSPNANALGCPALSSSATAGSAFPRTWHTSEAMNASSAEDVTTAMEQRHFFKEHTAASLSGCDSTPLGPRLRTSGASLETLRWFQSLNLLQDLQGTKCTTVDHYHLSNSNWFASEYNKFTILCWTVYSRSKKPCRRLVIFCLYSWHVKFQKGRIASVGCDIEWGNL